MKKIKIKIRGRPGWHIECSVMSQKFTKADTLDIHAGGRDLIFPHHENEIAQSEAYTGKPFAKYWMHHGLLTINGQKMAKSLGNFVTIKDFIAKRSDADILKLLFLSAHYSHGVDYNDEKIEESKKQKKAFDNFFDKVNFWQPNEGKSKTPTSKEDTDKIDAICDEFQKAMDDDFNTPQALACLFQLIDLSSSYVSVDKEDAFNYGRQKLEDFFEIFELKAKQKKKLPKEAKKKIKERNQARRNKDFKKADDIRHEIETIFEGNLMDTGCGVTFIEK